MKLKQVLVVEPSGNLWGSERVLLDFLSAEMNSEEFEITVCYPAGSPIEKELKKKLFKLFPHFSSELHLKSVLARLFFIFKITLKTLRIHPDIIYVNQAGATRCMIPSAFLLRIPIVSHIRLLEDTDYIASCYSKLFSRIYPVAISTFIHHALDQKEQIPNDKYSCIYDLYLPSANSNLTKSSLSLVGNTPFVCVGRLGELKGQSILLDALRVLKSRDVLCNTRFIGTSISGSDYGLQLKAKCDRLMLNDVTEWLGFKEDVFSIMKDSIALIFPARNEALGRVVFEAWDIGLVPIAWSGSGGPAEVIQASGGGILYEDQSGECLAESMEEVRAMSSEHRLQLIENGRLWMRTNCSKEVYVSQMLGLWRNAMVK